jgi:hypothetical protein
MTSYLGSKLGTSTGGTYSTALADLVNAQFHHNFANNWGDGTTSSSDGQRFRASSKAQSTGHVNPKYGSDPGRTFYTHISDQYAPFSTKVVNVGIRDSTYVLDGLLIERAIEAQREVGKSIDDELLQYLSPLGWEHINLTGDYVWRQSKATGAGQFRSLRLSKMLK